MVSDSISNWRGSGLGQINATQAAMSVPIATLIAPSDPNAGGPVFKDGFSAGWMWRNPVDVALASYGCNFQVFGKSGNKTSIWDWHNTHGQNGLSSLVDGTSKTLIVAERRMGCGPAGRPNNSDTFGNAWGHPADDRYWPVFGRINVGYTDDRSSPT